jgi:hypothetical protein
MCWLAVVHSSLGTILVPQTGLWINARRFRLEAEACSASVLFHDRYFISSAYSFFLEFQLRSEIPSRNIDATSCSLDGRGAHMDGVQRITVDYKLSVRLQPHPPREPTLFQFAHYAHPSVPPKAFHYPHPLLCPLPIVTMATLEL